MLRCLLGKGDARGQTDQQREKRLKFFHGYFFRVWNEWRKGAEFLVKRDATFADSNYRANPAMAAESGMRGVCADGNC